MPLPQSSLGVDWIPTPNGLPTGFYRYGPDIGDNGSTSYVTNIKNSVNSYSVVSVNWSGGSSFNLTLPDPGVAYSIIKMNVFFF